MRATGAILAAEIAMAHGRTSDALRAVAAGANMTPARSLEYEAVFASLPFRATPAAEATHLRDELLAVHENALIGPGLEHVAANSIYRPRRAYLLAMLSLKAGDTTGATRYVTQLERDNNGPMDHSYSLAAARLIRAELLRARKQPAQALALLGAPEELPARVLPDQLQYPSAHERFLRAQLLGDLGRLPEALRWYDTFPDPGGYDIMYLAPVHLAEAAAYEQMGNRDAARASYERAADLLAHADPDWAPLAARARTRAAALSER
jgi:tetratricopeptide (TPR) repeat protein